ncbi:hypothetical protein Mgra_00002916 [Meloidogyne graminicola]|uniref:Uncharacterized protein n=1 Tax=Meloidogyne graminicola TaxID=189291 RepID=A0A8S9ZWP5_9BILA|nr:hypothetical protein Mgra_00002916 [Meloidogyne graminicola]
MNLIFILIQLFLFNSSLKAQFNFGTRGDHHTTGTILQTNGGGVQRDDGHTQYFAYLNAYNNPSNK